MNHILPHSFMLLPLPRSIHTFQEKRGGMNHYELYTRITLIFLLQFFRDGHSEYEDHMDILKCIPSVRLSDMPTIDVSEKQTAVIPSEFSPKGAVG